MTAARVLLLAALLAGCESSGWLEAPSQYRCTSDQMQRVRTEADWCIGHTDYNSRYCYATAIIRACEPIAPCCACPGLEQVDADVSSIPAARCPAGTYPLLTERPAVECIGADVVPIPEIAP